MTSQLWRPFRACAKHVRGVWLCVGAILLVATPAFCSTLTVGSYNNWQWNGFTGTSTFKTKAATKSTSSSATATSKKTASTTPLSLTYSALSPSTTDSKSASLAGLVYYDANANGVVDSSDWAIFDAKVSLISAATGDVTVVAYTKSDGTYNFGDLFAGKYSIALSISDSKPGSHSNPQRRMTDSAGNAVSTGLGTVEQDRFSNITLGDGYTGINYTFAQLAYPASLITKRLYTSNGTGVIHTQGNPVPEPSTFVLLAVAGLFLGGFTWRRCRNQRG